MEDSVKTNIGRGERIEGRNEGLNVERKKERKKGRKEGREEGRKEGRKEGEKRKYRNRGVTLKIKNNTEINQTNT